MSEFGFLEQCYWVAVYFLGSIVVLWGALGLAAMLFG